jgi:hypothetical protein
VFGCQYEFPSFWICLNSEAENANASSGNKKAERFRRAKRYVAVKHPSYLRKYRRINVPDTFLRMPTNDFLEEYVGVVYAAGFKAEIIDDKCGFVTVYYTRFLLRYALQVIAHFCGSFIASASIL